MKLFQKSMCFKAAIGQIEICRTNISIPTHDHVVDPTDGVRGVISSKQGYSAFASKPDQHMILQFHPMLSPADKTHSG